MERSTFWSSVTKFLRYIGIQEGSTRHTIHSFSTLNFELAIACRKIFIGCRVHLSCRLEVSSLMKTPSCGQHNQKLYFVLVIESNFIRFIPMVGILFQFMILKFCSFQLNIYIKKQLSCRGWYMKNAKLRKCLFSKMFRQWEKRTFFLMKKIGEEQDLNNSFHLRTAYVLQDRIFSSRNKGKKKEENQ